MNETTTVKQYMIAMYQPEGVMPPPEFLERVMAELAVVRRELEATGSWVFGNGLHDPGTATVLRRGRDGETLVTDGPFLEGKEHLGGITVIKAADLDAALDVGRRYAEITGLPIEVWPFRGEVEA
jgi:hypothetical protein